MSPFRPDFCLKPLYIALEAAKKGFGMDRIINMIIRQVMNQLIRRGVNAGFDQASKMGKRGRSGNRGDSL